MLAVFEDVYACSSFLNALNSQHGNIKFTIEKSIIILQFLNVDIKITDNQGWLYGMVRKYGTVQITDNRSLFVATRVKKQTKNKVKDLTRKLGTRMETGRLRRDLLGLRVEQPPGLLFNGLI